MKNNIIKSIVLIITLFILITNVNAATGSGSPATNIKIYQTAANGHNYQYVGYYNQDGNTYAHAIMHYSSVGKNDTKDTAYCMQVHKKEPVLNVNDKYTLITKYDVRNCKKINDASFAYGACGLAEIMYQIKNNDEYNKIKKYNNGSGDYRNVALRNDNWGYGVITTAMRLWIVYLKNYEKHWMVEGIDKTNKVYYNTVERIIKYKYSGDLCSNLGKNSKILCYTNSNNSVYETSTNSHPAYLGFDSKYAVQTAIKLFKHLYNNRNMAIQDGRFGEKSEIDVNLYIKEKEKIETALNDAPKWNMTVEAKLNSQTMNKVLTRCNPEKDGNCSQVIEVIDANGSSIGYCKGNDIHNGKSCYRIEYTNGSGKPSGKDSYLLTFKIYNYKLCTIDTKTGEIILNLKKPGLKFNLKGGYEGFANLRVYAPSNNDTNTQLMITYIDNYKEFDDINVDIKGDIKSYNFPFEISDVSCERKCDSNSECSDLEQKTDISKSGDDSSSIQTTCSTGNDNSGMDFQFKTIEDPNMSCILNNCDTTKTLNFDKTTILNTNSSGYGICKAYCRDEVRFYVPSPVSVNAGMQFYLDVGKSLIRQKVIDKQIDSNKKLTSVVVRYTQCTTVLDGSKYNTLLTSLRSQYDEAKYDINNKITEKQISSKKAEISKTQASKNSTCSSANSCVSKTGDEDSIKKCNTLRTSCNNLISKLSTLQTELTTLETRLKTYKDWKANNPTKIKNIRVNKEYCLMDSKDELNKYIDKIEDEGVKKTHESTSIKDKVENLGKESATKTSLEVSYDEGYDTEMASDTKQVSIENKWCVGNDCYKYNSTKDLKTCETNYDNFKTSNSVARTAKKYTTSYYKKSLGGYVQDKNIYSTMLIKYQTDYYLNSKYKYALMTGNVLPSDSTKEAKDIPNYNYPVSIERETGTYGIKYKFKNMFKNNSKGYTVFDYNCYYNVYNTTKKNDCEFAKDGKVDLSRCSNKCFVIDKNGNSIVDENCVKWNTNSKRKTIGISYRNVNLRNMFPVARGSRNNWNNNEVVLNPFVNKKGIITSNDDTIKVETLIDNTEATGNNIYNKEHLEASYNLTPETINKIKEYNKNAGGSYLNDTSTNCKKVVHNKGGEYYKCESSFINEKMNIEYNAKVGGN